MSHLAVKIDGEYAVLNNDTSIDIEMVNPFFNEGTAETSSHPFTIPIEGNRKLLGNIDCIESDFDPVTLEKKRIDVEVEGVMMARGKIGNIEDQTIHDSIGIQMVSSIYSLDEYLDGVRCRDVPVDDDILIGETLGEFLVLYECTVDAGLYYSDVRDKYKFQKLTSFTKTGTVNLDNQLPALGFSRPDASVIIGAGAAYSEMSAYSSNGDAEKRKEPAIERSYINVIDPYPAAKFFNARVAYLHHSANADNPDESSDDIIMKRELTSGLGMYNPYLVLDANRPASGICFYVLYFLDCLFRKWKEDGIVYDDSNLLRVRDLCRLAFYTTHCKFVTRRKDYPTYGTRHLTNIDQINHWFQSHNIDTKVEVVLEDKHYDVDSATIEGEFYEKGGNYEISNVNHVVDAVRFNTKHFVNGVYANVMDMYASSQNFPDADAKDVIDSLWGSFGIRFFIDQQSRIVKPVFIRDVLRSNEPVIDFPCVVISSSRSTNITTGFRMKYSEESDEQQKNDNITTGSTDYDTVYDYQDYSNLNATLTFSDISQQAYDTNMTCYVDFNTGNLYRVKIDSEAEKRSEYHPSVFEVGQLHGVEIGDCSKENEDRIVEVSSSFKPVIPNDVSYRDHGDSLRSGAFTDEHITFSGMTKIQTKVAFVGEDMWHEYISRKLEFPIGDGVFSAGLLFTSKTIESFDATSSKDGDSPLQSLDWGLAVTFMRGGGDDAEMTVYDYNYEGLDANMFGCAKYRLTPTSSYAADYDSIDSYGRMYDYDGAAGPGAGSGDVNGTYDGTYTRSEAMDMVSSIWCGSNADLLSPWREVSVEDALAKGWVAASGATYCTVLSVAKSIKDGDGIIREFLVTPITDMGEILTPSELDDYLAKIEEIAVRTRISVMAIDGLTDRDEIIGLGGGGRRMFIQQFDVKASDGYHSPYADFYASLLHQFHDIIYGNGTSVQLRVPDGLWIEHGSIHGERISMKIRTFIPAPHDMYAIDGTLIPKGDPLCRPEVARRGLFDQFMSEYADFVLHRKPVVLQIMCQPSAIKNIDWSRRYRFGDYVGWINRIRTHISVEKGLETCEVELYMH